MVAAALAAASASAALQLVPASRKAVEGDGIFECKGRAGVERDWLVRHGVNCAPLE